MDGTFTQDGERNSLGLERTFAHPPDRVRRTTPRSQDRPSVSGKVSPRSAAQSSPRARGRRA